MYSTIEDLYRWDRALKTEELVKQETLNKIFKKHVTTSNLSNKGYADLAGVSENVKNKDIYKKYIGTYDFINGTYLTISEKSGKPYAQATGQEAFEIFPLSENQYFYKVLDAKITFERDQAGEVIGLIFDQNVVKIPASKI